MRRHSEISLKDELIERMNSHFGVAVDNLSPGLRFNPSFNIGEFTGLSIDDAIRVHKEFGMVYVAGTTYSGTGGYSKNYRVEITLGIDVVFIHRKNELDNASLIRGALFEVVKNMMGEEGYTDFFDIEVRSTVPVDVAADEGDTRYIATGIVVNAVMAI